MGRHGGLDKRAFSHGSIPRQSPRDTTQTLQTSGPGRPPALASDLVARVSSQSLAAEEGTRCGYAAPPPSSPVILNTISLTKRLNASFSTNCLYT